MSADFITYPFANKTIRVRYDVEANKHWFVIEDVLCVFFPNGEKFWEGLKNVLAAEGLSSPEAYVAYQTPIGIIDVADLQQMMHIIAYIPRRTRKKEMVAYWLYNHKESDTSVDEVFLKPYEQKIITQIHRRKAEKPPHEVDDNAVAVKITVILIIMIILHIICAIEGGFTESQLHIGWALMELVLFYAIVKTKERAKEGKNKSSNKKPVQISIIDKIVNILKDRVMTYAEKEAIVEEAVSLGEKRRHVYHYIHTAIKDAIILHKKNELTQCVKCQETIPDDSEQCPFCGDFQIWPKIQKLTALALSDRVLTDLERQTIVNKAVEWGISREEINQYLDDQLNLRLEYYTKVDLRDCPYCGAQIPLISDECMYCGKPLEHVDNRPPQPIRITSEEAEIIRSENQRVETKRHGIKHCPDCGAPFPLISNICQSCGHVLHERDENKLNIQNLRKSIEESIQMAAKAQKPSARGIVIDYLHIFIFIISLFALFMGFHFHNDFFKYSTTFGLFTFILMFIVNISKEKISAIKTNEEYYKAKYAYEMYLRQVKTLYGDDPEAKPLLNKFAEIINQLKEDRRKSRFVVARKITNLFLWSFGIIYLLCLLDFFEPKAKKWTIPQGTEELISITKHLKPYPSIIVVDYKGKPHIYTNQNAELTFVLSSVSSVGNGWFRWKLSKLKFDQEPYKEFNRYKHRFHIVLLDKHLTKITDINDDYMGNNDIIIYNKKLKQKNIYIDFFGIESSSNIEELKRIANNAEYYTIEVENGR